LFSYGKYGSLNPFTNIIPEDELKTIDPATLTDLIKDLYSYQHRMFYYGQAGLNKIVPVIEKYHEVPVEPKPYPDPVKYVEQTTDKSQVFFVDYDMSQVNILFLAKGPLFNKELMPPASLFGEYFGSGLSSIVFQEIREARGYAYSAFSAFATPAKMDESHFVYGFVGTQADKLQDATNALLELMSDMPKAQKQFDLARESIIKKIETERITKTNKFWTYQRNLDRGITYDIRKDVYDYTQAADMDQFSSFFDEYIKGNNYTFLILGNKKQVDMNALGELGIVKELTLEEVFNY
jgi:predicted Zn-dependent peptidase